MPVFGNFSPKSESVARTAVAADAANSNTVSIKALIFMLALYQNARVRG